MAKRERRALAPIERTELWPDGNGKTTVIDTGITPLHKSTALRDGKVQSQVTCSISISSCRENEPIFFSHADNARHLLVTQHDLPKGVQELGERCIEQLDVLGALCRSYELRKQSKAEAVKLPRSFSAWKPANTQQEALHNALALAFAAGEAFGKLTVARPALIGVRHSNRLAESNRKRKLPDSEIRKRVQAVNDELAAQSRRDERVSRERAYQNVADRLSCSKETVKKAYLDRG